MKDYKIWIHLVVDKQIKFGLFLRLYQIKASDIINAECIAKRLLLNTKEEMYSIVEL